MTNPDNIVRVRARNGGRASVYEANGWAQAYSNGLLEGNGVMQNTSADMNVLVGGSASKPDVVLAENPAGYKIALDLVGQQPVAITAPAANSRISAIVAYTDDLSLASSESSVTGSPASCGLIVVNGSAASSPVAPTDTQIRTAITADGATGSQASYAIIATVEVASSTTIITSNLITNNQATLGADKIDFATLGGNYSTNEIETGYKWIDGKMIYKKTIDFGTLPNNANKQVAHGISDLDIIVKVEQHINNGSSNPKGFLVLSSGSFNTPEFNLYGTNTTIAVTANADRSSIYAYFTLYYTKTN